jgi:hypothetical protein
MTDRMQDDKNKGASTKLSPTSANKHLSNAQQGSFDKEIPKKKKFQRTDDRHRSLVYDIHFRGQKCIPGEREDIIAITLMTVDAMEHVCHGITSFLICKSILKRRYVFLVLMSFTATATWNVLGLKISFA